MSQHVRSLKLTDEEETLLTVRAREAGLYEHGFIKAALRIALGLPVSRHAERAFSQVTPTR